LNIEEFFAILKDGAWHDVYELADHIGIQTNKLIEFSQFLSEQGIIKYEDKTHRIKIEPEWKRLLPIESEPGEPKTTVATFIIPPETTIDAQYTRISNMSKIELEVTLRISNKIQEVAINV
jgi:hypothetical protein